MVMWRAATSWTIAPRSKACAAPVRKVVESPETGEDSAPYASFFERETVATVTPERYAVLNQVGEHR